MAPLRQALRFALPWQKVVLGLVLVAVGVLIDSGFVAALGAVIVVLTAVGVVRRRYGTVAADVVERDER